MRTIVAVALVFVCSVSHARAQGMGVLKSSRRPAGRISFIVDAVQRDDSGAPLRQYELSTGITFATPESDGSGIEYGLNLRHAQRTSSSTDRLSLYDAFIGARFGPHGLVRVRGGHMWLPDLGTGGALAGGLVEFVQPRADRQHAGIRAGIFGGREPSGYEPGYVPGVKKLGGYVGLEQGYLRRHVVGYTRVEQGGTVERSILSLTNFIPAGRSVFVYQVAEFDVSGPADGVGRKGLSYFVTNGRFTFTPRVELFASHNRGRSIDARSLTDDVRNGRAVTTDRLDGLLYESTGGRITLEVARGVRIYAGFARDRNNRDDAPTGRLTLGGHAGNLLRTGFDVSVSNSRIDRPTGAYDSRYVSVGHAIGQSIYVSGDYATSLSVIRFVRSDGVIIETRPWTRRLSANASVTLGRRFSLFSTAEFDRDDQATQFRAMTGLSIRY